MAQCLMFLRNGMFWKSQTTDSLHPLKAQCVMFDFVSVMFLGICCFLVNLLAPSTKPNNQPSRGKDNGPLIGSMNYEELLAEGDPMARWDPPIDEWDSLSLCYTSGTTADPKGAQMVESPASM